MRTTWGRFWPWPQWLARLLLLSRQVVEIVLATVSDAALTANEAVMVKAAAVVKVGVAAKADAAARVGDKAKVDAAEKADEDSGRRRIQS